MTFKDWTKEHGFLSGLLFFVVGVLLGLFQILILGIQNTKTGVYLCLFYGGLLAFIDSLARGSENE